MVPQDSAEAMRWYRLAAEQEYVIAQYNLGVMYFNDRGVTQGFVQAHMWSNLAASRMTGELRERAVHNRDLAESRLTPAALNEAQRLAREWDAAHPQDILSVPTLQGVNSLATGRRPSSDGLLLPSSCEPIVPAFPSRGAL